jgi:hypothetical protein
MSEGCTRRTPRRVKITSPGFASTRSSEKAPASPCGARTYWPTSPGELPHRFDATAVGLPIGARVQSPYAGMAASWSLVSAAVPLPRGPPLRLANWIVKLCGRLRAPSWVLLTVGGALLHRRRRHRRHTARVWAQDVEVSAGRVPPAAAHRRSPAPPVDACPADGTPLSGSPPSARCSGTGTASSRFLEREWAPSSGRNVLGRLFMVKVLRDEFARRRVGPQVSAERSPPAASAGEHRGRLADRGRTTLRSTWAVASRRSPRGCDAALSRRCRFSPRSATR